MRTATAEIGIAAPVNKRAHARTRTALVGKMFVPAEERTVDCGIVDLSAGGAGITCSDMPPLETYVVLYIDTFGRFESVVTRVVGDVLGLRFVCTEAKRKRLVEQLTQPVAPPPVEGAALRKDRRIKVSPISFFTRVNGDRVGCEIIDISLTGASLKTDKRPPIGEMVLIGQMAARVVRHHEQGVGIAFATTN
ncbi:MAG TPA: PilZ domain-containing protein [Rhizomicrobium sp.]|nr:PilZ domain-containing protein [Rhizomicrobium sp.]